MGNPQLVKTQKIGHFHAHNREALLGRDWAQAAAEGLVAFREGAAMSHDGIRRSVDALAGQVQELQKASAPQGEDEECIELIRRADDQELQLHVARQAHAELGLAFEDLALSSTQGLAGLEALIGLEIQELSRGRRFAYKPGAAVYHAVASARPLMTPKHHETRCGWPFGLSPNTRRFDAEPRGLQIRRMGQLQPVLPCLICWDPQLGEAD